MNVLILGSGGREHAFAWKISQSPLCDALFVGPGNAGTAAIATNLSIQPTDFEQVKQSVLANAIDLLVIGPEQPLVEGLVDQLKNDPALQNLGIIGPGKIGAQLEGSKDFSKAFMHKYGIPTAQARTFDKNNWQEGLDYLRTLPAPYVLKADGLAAGKGVLIIEDLAQAQKSLEEMITANMFGQASEKVLVEEFLDGIEFSVFVLTDGESFKILPVAKDYKRIGENDTGLNTGGMGAVSPVPFVDKEFMDKVSTQIIEPTIEGLKKENIPYCGFIFFGLINVGGQPKVIEYNARMGDPETEVVLPRISSDLLDLLHKCTKGQLAQALLTESPQTALTTVLVSGGYPEKYVNGFEIFGLENTTPLSEVTVFHAGTKAQDNKIVTNGGRVLALTAMAENLPKAQALALQAAGKICFEHLYFRKDIGKDLLQINSKIN